MLVLEMTKSGYLSSSGDSGRCNSDASFILHPRNDNPKRSEWSFLFGPFFLPSLFGEALLSSTSQARKLEAGQLVRQFASQLVSQSTLRLPAGERSDLRRKAGSLQNYWPRLGQDSKEGASAAKKSTLKEAWQVYTDSSARAS